MVVNLIKCQYYLCIYNNGAHEQSMVYYNIENKQKYYVLL